MAENRRGGTRIAVAGISSAAIEAIASEYIRQNAGSIGASEQQVNRAVEIAQAMPEQVRGYGRESVLTWIEGQRRHATRGKSAAETERLNDTYDLVLGYYALQYNLAEASNGTDARGYVLPRLDSMTDIRDEAYYRLNPNIEIPERKPGAMSGAWRYESMRLHRAHEQRAHEQTRSSMNSFDAALDELARAGNWSQARRQAAHTMIGDAVREADRQGVAEDRRVNFIRQQLDLRDGGIGESDADRAERVFNRALELAEAGGQGSNFFARRNGAARSQPATQQPANQQPANARKLDISGDRPGLELARAEMLPLWTPFKDNAAYTQRLDALLNSLPEGTLAEQSIHLYQQAEAAREAGNDVDYRSNRMALALIQRAAFIERERAAGRNEVNGVTNLVNQVNQSYTTSARLANDGTSAAQPPSAENGGAAGDGEPSAPPRLRTSTRAQEVENASLALTDDALLAFTTTTQALYVGVGDTEALRDLQQSLNRIRATDGHGGLEFGADGIYGVRTKEAVQELQERYGLTVDGIAGRETLTALQLDEVRVLVENLKADGLTAEEKEQIKLELEDVAQAFGSGAVPAGVLNQLDGVLRGLTEASGGADVAQDSVFGTAVQSIRTAAGRS